MSDGMVGGLIGILMFVAFVGIAVKDHRNNENDRSAFFAQSETDMLEDLTWLGDSLGYAVNRTIVLTCTSSGVVDGTMTLDLHDQVMRVCAEGRRRLQADVRSAPEEMPATKLTVDTSDRFTITVLDNGNSVCNLDRIYDFIEPAKGVPIVKFEAVAPACAMVARRMKSASETET